LIEELTKKGIKALIGTYASHIQPIYKSKDVCPNSKFVFDRAIALPIHHDLTPDDIAYIVDVMREIVKSSYI
jgi:dTDP-4-amino-4,6-dideoxygalactose transaminase